MIVPVAHALNSIGYQTRVPNVNALLVGTFEEVRLQRSYSKVAPVERAQSAGEIFTKFQLLQTPVEESPGTHETRFSLDTDGLRS